MKTGRRKFLTAGAILTTAAAAVGGGWLASSDHRGARLTRALLADAQRAVLPAPVQPTPDLWPKNAVTVCWIGHATVLINFYGLVILTDPVFSARVGVDLGLGTVGPKRFVAPALALADLPPLDLILLSHAHMDHLDYPSLRRLPPGVPIVTASETAELLPGRREAPVTELRWGGSTRVVTARGDIVIEAFEVRHWGRRWPSDKERGYNGYLLQREGNTLLFGGDTAYTPRFADLRPRGPFEVAIMPIAAYQPWIRSHCTPEEAVRMADLAGARRIVPIHHQTFQLSDEPMDEPMARLEAALAAQPERMALRRIGETISFA